MTLGWREMHRFALIIVLAAVTASYATLALVASSVAETVGIGYIAVVVTLLAILRRRSRDDA